MRRFHSIARRQVSFELLGHKHTLDPGDELAMPEEFAYLVKARRLPLAPGPSPVDGAKVARSEPIAPPPQRVPTPVVEEEVEEDESEAVPSDEPEPEGAADDAIDEQLAAAAKASGRRPRSSRSRAE